MASLASLRVAFIVVAVFAALVMAGAGILNPRQPGAPDPDPVNQPEGADV